MGKENTERSNIQSGPH